MWLFFYRERRSPRPGRTKLYRGWKPLGTADTKTQADSLYYHYVEVNKIPPDQIKVEQVEISS